MKIKIKSLFHSRRFKHLKNLSGKTINLIWLSIFGLTFFVAYVIAASAATEIGTFISTDGNLTVKGNTVIGDQDSDTLTVQGTMSIGTATLSGTTPTIDFTNFDVATSGNIDTAGTIQAGSSNVNITLSTGNLDADSIGLISSDGAGGTSTGSGLETDTDRLGLLQGCSDGQVLKWVDATNIWNCAADGGGSLQAGYDGGNTITTTTARNIAITLDDTATDSHLTVTTATSSTSQTRFILANGAGTTPPDELILIDNQDTNLTITNGITLQAATGGVITNGINVSDADLTAAINVGANAIEATELDFNVAPTGGTSSIAVTASAANEDFTISVAGAFDADLIFSSAGTAADALEITASAGGIDILASGAAAGEDIDIVATGSSVNISSTEATSDALVLDASSNTGGVRVISGDNEATVIANGNDIELMAEDDVIISLTAAGQLVIDAATNVNSTAAAVIDVDADLTAASSVALDLNFQSILAATGTVNGIVITPDQSGGTAAANTYTMNAIDIAAVSGVCPTGATCTVYDFDLQQGAQILNATNNEVHFVENSLTYIMDFGEVASTVKTESTSKLEFESTNNAADSIVIDSTIGGIDILASGAAAGEDIDITATGSSVKISSTEAATDAISIFATDANGTVVIGAGEAASTGAAGVVQFVSETIFDSTANVTFGREAPAAYTGATQTLTPSSSFVFIECNRAGPADTAITLDETGVRTGQLLIIVVSGHANTAGTCSIANSVGVQRGQGTTMDDFDSTSWIHDGTAWIQISASNNS